MPKRRDSDQEPFKTWNELQDHRYDPGHWTGGRVHPLYRRRSTGNKYGCVLVPAGMLTIAYAASMLRHVEFARPYAVLALVAGVIAIVAGFRLIGSKPPQ